MIRYPVFLILSAAALNFAPSIAAGQMSKAKCDTAAVALARGARDGSGWEHLPDCGPAGARALAKAFRAARADSDVSYLGQLYTAMASVRDPAVFNSALEVMQDPTAGARARATAILIAVAQHDRRVGLHLSLPYAEAVSSPTGEGCRLVPVGRNARYRSTAPLPLDYLQQLERATENLVSSLGTPPLVRDFASCARRALGGAFAAAVPSSAIRLVYLCGNRFQVTNQSRHWIKVSWDMSGTRDTGDLVVPPDSGTVFTTEQRGPIRLHYGGRVVGTEANGAKACG